jgi:hypothetical protein
VSIEEMMPTPEYKDFKKFRANSVNLLEKHGLISKTNPEKPTASNQKYVITEKGKRYFKKKCFLCICIMVYSNSKS